MSKLLYVTGLNGSIHSGLGKYMKDNGFFDDFNHYFARSFIIFKNLGNEVFIESLSCISQLPPKAKAAITLVINTR